MTDLLDEIESRLLFKAVNRVLESAWQQDEAKRRERMEHMRRWREKIRWRKQRDAAYEEES